MNVRISRTVYFLLVVLLLSSPHFAQENKSRLMPIDAFINATTKGVRGAVIEKVRIVSVSSRGEIKFNLDLKSRVITDDKGEFTIEIPKEQYDRIADNTEFEMIMKIKPPRVFEGVYDSDEAAVKMQKRPDQQTGKEINITDKRVHKFTFILTFQITPQPGIRGATNKGSFSINPKGTS